MEVLGIILGIVGILIGVYFGIRSMFQSSDMEFLQKALRANSQAVYNHLGRMGANAQELKSATDLQTAKELATGINEVSQAAQSSVIAFSREHAQFVPRGEPPWEPEPITQRARPAPFWRRLFFLTD